MRIGLSVMMLLAAALQAGENLLPNGSFDEGGKEALHWEKTDNLTSFWRNDGQHVLHHQSINRLEANC